MYLRQPKSSVLTWLVAMCICSVLTGALHLLNATSSTDSGNLPLLLQVDEIAVGNERVYCLDNMYDKIYIYNIDGAFHSFVVLPFWGQKYIHFENEELEVLITAKDRNVLMYYDEDGVFISEAQLESANDVSWHDSIVRTESVDCGETHYEFIDRIILPSVIKASGSVELFINVEPFVSHLIWNVSILTWASSIIYGSYCLLRHYLKDPK